MTDSNHPTPSDDPRSGAALQADLEELLDGRLDDASADALRARIEREPAVREVWDELVRQKRLLDRGLGTYELPPGG